MIKYIQGDLTTTHIKTIAHGVNCQDKMGSGVAKALFNKWPKVKEGYHMMTIGGDREQLGKIAGVCVDRENEIQVLNLYTQFNYGYDGAKYVSYDAIHDAFVNIKNSGYKEIAIPKIGCGLAGGDWDIVEKIINNAVGDEVDVYVYYL